MIGYAVDMASYAGVLTPAMARRIVAMGFTKFIINLWCDGINYDVKGRAPGEWGYEPFGAKTTVEWQVDSAREAGAEVDGYIYYYFAEDAESRTYRLLGNLKGRVINFLWLDWEDDTTILSPEDTVAYIHRAQDACIGVVYTGHYTRRLWWVERTNDSQDFAGQWIWDATNDQTPDMSYIPYGGFKHYMEQYAFDVQLLPDMAGPVDLNVFTIPDPPPEPEPAPVPDPEPPQTEPSAVEKAIDAMAKVKGFEESLRIALEEADAAVKAIPEANLRHLLSWPPIFPEKTPTTGDFPSTYPATIW